MGRPVRMRPWTAVLLTVFTGFPPEWWPPGRWGGAAIARGGTFAHAEPLPASFVDDGMFDPRRDYWGRGSTLEGNGTRASRRRLSTSSSGTSSCGTSSSSSPCCIECFGLAYCDTLNGYMVEDKYYPTEATILGSCENFEDRASRLDVFGPEKTFRDTDTCREMVYDYTCLWWGSDNEMYDNRCGSSAQVYPCRSFCVQLAETCANNVEWKELCAAIDCPPIDEDCVPGPYTQITDEACYLYEYHSPLNGAAAAFTAGQLLSVAAPALLAAMALAGTGR